MSARPHGRPDHAAMAPLPRMGFLPSPQLIMSSGQSSSLQVDRELKARTQATMASQVEQDYRYVIKHTTWKGQSAQVLRSAGLDQ